MYASYVLARQGTKNYAADILRLGRRTGQSLTKPTEQSVLTTFLLEVAFFIIE